MQSRDKSVVDLYNIVNSRDAVFTIGGRQRAAPRNASRG